MWTNGIGEGRRMKNEGRMWRAVNLRGQLKKRLFCLTDNYNTAVHLFEPQENTKNQESRKKKGAILSGKGECASDPGDCLSVGWVIWVVGLARNELSSSTCVSPLLSSFSFKPLCLIERGGARMENNFAKEQRKCCHVISDHLTIVVLCCAPFPFWLCSFLSSRETYRIRSCPSDHFFSFLPPAL